MFHQTALRIAPYRRWYASGVLSQIRRRKRVVAKFSDDELRRQSLELKFRASSGEAPHRLIPHAFALAQEASARSLGMRHFDVQLQAGIHLASKCIVEMATGEGKTLTAILPLYLYGLYGRGAHLATANDYLARRDSEETSPVFALLGLSVGCIQEDKDDGERREAYECDVTYGTMTEFGFDFLRDRMKRRVQQSHEVDDSGFTEPVCRKLHYVLVDEADSIMIDDASTPLIIGGNASKELEEKANLYRWAARFAPQAREGKEYTYIEHKKKVNLVENGRLWSRRVAGGTDADQFAASDQFEFMERAIKVERQYFRDRNYVLNEDEEVIIVDESTGRLAVNRFWQDGLHQAIQAREGVTIAAPSTSAARVSVQSLVSSYPLRAGMTGTAVSGKREFRKAYKMGVVPVPTRLPCIRRKLSTRYFRSESDKFQAIRDDIFQRLKSRQPVLVGTRSVQQSERLAKLLDQSDIEYTILNARNEAVEASIIKEAGEPATVTISTNMAGRGTDIKLPNGVIEQGGLHVIVTELNHSKRIDRQLIGRCARQGDPGSYQIYISRDDEIFEQRHRNNFWRRLIPYFSREWVFKRAQRNIADKKTRDRLRMLHLERKRLRDLRQAGLDPVLDVVD